MIDLDNVYLKKGREGDLGLILEDWEGVLRSNNNLIKDDHHFNENNWRTEMISSGNKIGYIIKGGNYLKFSISDISKRRKALSIIRHIAQVTELVLYLRIGGWLEVEFTKELDSKLNQINYQLNE